MTDEEIIALAQKTREEKYCDKYNNGSVLPSEKCEHCPLFDNEVSTCCCNVYDVAFLDGCKATMEYISRSNRKGGEK